MDSKLEPLDYAARDALIRRARAERDRELARLIAHGARALVRLAKAAGASLLALYEADRERSSSHARAALRRWAQRP